MEELHILEQVTRRQQASYFGKYRAFVHDNEDPEMRGRVKLLVPSVSGDVPTDWALPCFPYGGAKDLGFFAVPPNKAAVMCEFIEGDINAPIWTGAIWRSAEDVAKEITDKKPTVKLWKTEAGHYLKFEDKEGDEHITLESKAKATATLDHKGSIALTDAKGATVTLDADKGEVLVKDANGNEILMNSSGITAKDGNGNKIVTEASGITVKGSVITIEGSQILLGGQGGEPLVKGMSFMTLFNTHVHTTTGPGAPTSPSLMPMTPAQLSTVSMTK